MRKYLVSFTLPDGNAYTQTVEAMTAMLAIRIAHDKVTETATLRDSVVIVCTMQE